MLARKIDGYCPQCKYRQCLVSPAKVVPDYIETVAVGDVVPQEGEREGEHRNADVNAFANRMLLYVQKFGYYQSCAAQCGVAACYWRGHHSEYCERAAECSEPSLRHGGYHFGSLQCGGNAKFGRRSSVEEV